MYYQEPMKKKIKKTLMFFSWAPGIIFKGVLKQFLSNINKEEIAETFTHNAFI